MKKMVVIGIIVFMLDPISSAAAEPWLGLTALRSAVDVAGAAYGLGAALAFAGAEVVVTQDGMVEYHRDFAYAGSASGAILFLTNASVVALSLTRPAREHMWRWVERAGIVASVVPMLIYGTRSNQYDGEQARLLMLAFGVPIVIDFGLTLLPYPK